MVRLGFIMLRVAVLDDYQKVAFKFVDWKKLKNEIDVVVFNHHISNQNKLIKMLYDFDILCLMRERTPLTADLIKKLPNLKLVITSGMWNASIDEKELKRKKIILCGTRNNYHSTAELSWLLTMLVWREIKNEFTQMEKGGWQNSIGKSLHGKTIGIFGLGKQGKQVAKFAKAFGMDVIAWSHNLTKEDCKKENVRYCNFDKFLKNSDILSIHTKLSERTKGFIDLKKIKKMKTSSIIINTSRGAIINEADLIYAIKNRLISGVGLDVYDIEPLPKGHELRNLHKEFNVVLTPHIGYVSYEGYEKFFQGYIEAIQSFLKGNPINVLN